MVAYSTVAYSTVAYPKRKEEKVLIMLGLDLNIDGYGVVENQNQIEDEEDTFTPYETEQYEREQIMELWEYTGRPEREEIRQRAEQGNKQIGFRHTCVYCGHSNTEFVRNIYWVCLDCLCSFTTYEAMENMLCKSYKEADGIRTPFECTDRQSINRSSSRQSKPRYTGSLSDLKKRLHGGN